MFRYDFRKLKTAREEQLLSQTELAKLANVSRATVCLVEKGNAPWKKAIRAIAEALQVKNVVITKKGTA